MKKHRYYFTKVYKYLINNEIKRNVLKFLKFNTTLALEIRQKSYLLLDLNFQKTNFNKIKLYCILTGRTHFVINKFKVSRLALKNGDTLFGGGVVNNTGVFKGSW